jgi:hypothetical protein
MLAIGASALVLPLLYASLPALSAASLALGVERRRALSHAASRSSSTPLVGGCRIARGGGRLHVGDVVALLGVLAVLAVLRPGA